MAKILCPSCKSPRLRLTSRQTKDFTTRDIYKCVDCDNVFEYRPDTDDLGEEQSEQAENEDNEQDPMLRLQEDGGEGTDDKDDV